MDINSKNQLDFPLPITEKNQNESLFDNSKIFYQKLRDFHESKGLSSAASDAENVVDLFMLFKEVQTRGGFNLVTKDGKWNEVVSALNFRTRVANPFQLEELYQRLLYQFELIHSVGEKSKQFLTLGSCSSSSPIEVPILGSEAARPVNGSYSSSVGLKAEKERLEYQWQFPTGTIDFGSHVSDSFSSVTGTEYGAGIEYGAEFDSGYLACSEELNDLLYHSKDSPCEKFALVPSLDKSFRLKVSHPHPVDSSKSKNRGRPAKKKDPKAPKRIRTAYQMYLYMECDRLKKLHGQSSLGAKQCRELIVAWNSLSENDRKPYVEESRKDKERYDREMVAYNRDVPQNKQTLQANLEPKSEPEAKAKTKNKKLKTSNEKFNDDGYHVSLQHQELNKLHEPDQLLVEYAAKMMENAEKLDASLRIELGDFLSYP